MEIKLNIRVQLALVNATQKLVVKNEGLIIPTPRMALGRVKDAPPVIDRNVKGACGVGIFEAGVKLFKVCAAHPHGDVSCVSGTEATRHASFVVLPHAAFNLSFCSRDAHVPKDDGKLVEIGITLNVFLSYSSKSFVAPTRQKAWKNLRCTSSEIPNQNEFLNE